MRCKALLAAFGLQLACIAHANDADIALTCSGDFWRSPTTRERLDFTLNIHFNERLVILRAPDAILPEEVSSVVHLNLVRADNSSIVFEAQTFSSIYPSLKRIAGIVSRIDGQATIALAESNPMGLLSGYCLPKVPRLT